MRPSISASILPDAILLVSTSNTFGEGLRWKPTRRHANASPTCSPMKTIFGILKKLSARETDIVGEGVVEVLPRRLRLSALVGSELPAGNVARRVGRSHHGDALG